VNARTIECTVTAIQSVFRLDSPSEEGREFKRRVVLNLEQFMQDDVHVSLELLALLFAALLMR
jgi:hypothetical protein